MSDSDFVEKLYKTVKTYKSTVNYSLFNAISDSYYRENYHSDILALYLKYPEVRKEFILWLNKELLLEGGKEININEYAENFDDYGEDFVDREKYRIDILLRSSNEKKAIIIENKSNNADDQPKQLIRYYEALKKEGITVDAIFYLNKTSKHKPDLDEDDIKKIEKLLVLGYLLEDESIPEKKDKSFTGNVIRKVIQNTNNIRLNALSQEIMDLFNLVINEDINMKALENFVKELSDNNNLRKLQNIIKENKKNIKKLGNELSDNELIKKLQKINEAYNYLPKYFVKKYLKYLDSKETKHKVWVYNPTTLVIDIKSEKGINYAIDVHFPINNTSFGLQVRDKSEEERKKILNKLKEKAGDSFPFKDLEGNRYKRYIKDTFDEIEIKKIFDAIIELANKHMV